MSQPLTCGVIYYVIHFPGLLFSSSQVSPTIFSCFFKLWQNIHKVKFILLTTFNSSVVINPFTLLCSHQYHPFLELLKSSQTEALYPLNLIPLLSLPTAPGTYVLLLSL